MLMRPRQVSASIAGVRFFRKYFRLAHRVSRAATTESSVSSNHSPMGTALLQSLVPIKMTMASKSVPCSCCSCSACRGMSFHCRPLFPYTYGVMFSSSCKKFQYFFFDPLFRGSVMESPKQATRLPAHGCRNVVCAFFVFCIRCAATGVARSRHSSRWIVFFIWQFLFDLLLMLQK